MFNLKKGQGIIFLINIIYLIIFLIIFLQRKNYEFVGYVVVVSLVLILVLYTNKKVNYPNIALWGLTLWGIMHMCGGGVLFNESTKKLYAVILIPLVTGEYNIFRYDQLVHIVGFGVSTLIMYAILKSHINFKAKGKVALGITVIMAGLGVGAVNEIIEFIATTMVETGVGGYVNNSLDLVADLIGALIAWGYIVIKKYEI